MEESGTERGVCDTHGFYNWFFVTQSDVSSGISMQLHWIFSLFFKFICGLIGIPLDEMLLITLWFEPKGDFPTSLPLQISSFRQSILKWVQLCSQLRIGPKLFPIYSSKNLVSAHPSASSFYRDSLVSAHCMLRCFLLMPFETALWSHLF